MKMGKIEIRSKSQKNHNVEILTILTSSFPQNLEIGLIKSELKLSVLNGN